LGRSAIEKNVWRRFLEKLAIPLLKKKFPAFYGTRKILSFSQNPLISAFPEQKNEIQLHGRESLKISQLLI
jgi:hypothetical protein